MDLFDLAAKISLDDSKFNAGIANAEKAGKGLGNSLQNTFSKVKNAAMVLVSGVAIKKGIDMMRELATETAAVGDRIDKQSQVLGMSRKAYQEWDYIMSQNGSSIDSMNTAMKTLNSLMLSAQESGGEAADSIAKLGLHVAELQAMSQEDQFEAVVKAFQKMPAGAQKSALAVKVFGRQGMELLPLLNSSSTSIDELRAKAQELGLIMSDDAVDASVAYTDALDTMQRTFNGLKYSIGAKILPALTNAMTKITGYAGKIRKAYEEKGLAGVWDTLVEDFKKIRWPTWDDVRNAIQEGWNSIVEGVKGLAKLVFGENVDGSIKWPTWAEIGEKIRTAWDGIVKGVKDLGTTVGKAVFGENVDGSIKWPKWADVQKAVEEGWKSIVDGVQTLATVVFGDKIDTSKIDSLGSLFTTIEEGWTKLRDTIVQKAIDIGTYFFGEENADTVSNAIKIVADALEAIGAAMLAYSLATGLPKVLESLRGLFTLDLGGTSKVGLILGAIAAAAVMIYEHWDEIEPVLQEIGIWLNDNIITPVSEFFNNLRGWVEQAIRDIKRFLGLNDDNRLEEGLLTTNEANDLTLKYRTMHDNKGDKMAVTDAEGNQTTLGEATEKNFYTALDKILQDAGMNADEIEEITEKIRTAEDPGWVSDFLYNLTTANGKAQELGKECDDVAGDYDVNFNINANDPYGLLNSGGIDAGSVFEGNESYKKVRKPVHHDAKGEWDIPYDDYLTRLHRDEMVLSASRARDYRDGNSGRIDLGGLKEAIVAAVRTGLENATVRSFINARDITDEINRTNMMNVKARRFAT